LKKYVFKWEQKTGSDGADVISCGRLLQIRTMATGKDHLDRSLWRSLGPSAGESQHWVTSNQWTKDHDGCLTCALQDDDKSLRPILVHSPDGYFVGRERVASGDKEPADDVEWRLLVHLGNDQLPRVFALSRDFPMHRVLQLPLPPRACRLWAEPSHWRTSVLWTKSPEIWSTSAEQGLTAVIFFFKFLSLLLLTDLKIKTFRLSLQHIHCESEKKLDPFSFEHNFGKYFHCCRQKLTATKCTLKSTTTPYMLVGR